MNPYTLLENVVLGLDRLVNEDERVSVTLSRVGGEMVAYDVHDRRQGCSVPLLWHGGEGAPGAWPGHATILFPIVGGLRHGESRCGAVRIRQGIHGFAQQALFTLAATQIDASGAALTYRLASSEATREGYPYDFILELTYALRGRDLTLTITVHNPGRDPLFYQCGWHPGFVLPSGGVEDWELRFQPGTARRHHGLEEGESFLTGAVSELALGGPLVLDAHSLQATLFLELPRAEDRTCRLVHRTLGGGLQLDFQEFPYLALWAQKGCDFLCIEPCQGLDDHVVQEPFDRKRGIVRLEPGETARRSATIRPLG